MARRRFNSSGIGGFLVTKVVKQTKVNSRLANQRGLDEILLAQTQGKEGTRQA